MESVRKARTRLWSTYPKLLSSCTVEASAYAQCVGNYMGEVQKHQCQKEFETFKLCIQNAAKKAGTRL